MVVNGGYAGHGETYMHPDDILWWSKGGVLHGESWKRFRFLRQIIEDMPPGGLAPQADSRGWPAFRQDGPILLVEIRRWL